MNVNVGSFTLTRNNRQLGHLPIRFGSVLGVLLIACSALFEVAAYEGSRFSEIRELIFREPYPERPTFRVDIDLFGPAGDRTDNALRAAARRILMRLDDLVDYPRGQKLLQANGICFAGEWVIDHESPYTGLFASAIQVPSIVRGSVLFSDTKQGNRRTFGLAIKLFPTQDFDMPVKTINLFVMETFGGETRAHIVDAVLDNDPDLGKLPKFSTLGEVLRLRKDLKIADEESSDGRSDLTFRPITHAAEVGLAQSTPASAPHWMRLAVAPYTPRIDADDFRDELSVDRYPDGEIVYQIDVAERGNGKKKSARWQALGHLRLSESVTSKACDARLHFAHPHLR